MNDDAPSPQSVLLRQSLTQALDEVDRAFGPRTGRIPTLDGCRVCCFTDDELDALSGPVDRIPDSALFSAVFSWGGTLERSVEWLRWITPRLLRLVVEGPAYLDDEMIAGRLHAAEWRTWPDAERQAVEALCSTWWQAALTGPVEEWSATSALSFLVPLTGEIAPWLDVWSGTSGRSADLQVRELWQEWGQDILAGSLDVAVYTQGPNIAPDLAAWLIRDGAHRLVDGDLDELEAWSLAQLPLPPEERWR